MAKLYPLRFTPLLKDYLWGGRRLGSLLRKSLPPEGVVAESWEICDRASEQSVVAEGPLAGRTLGELVRDFGRELFGRHAPIERFPLLIKFLDAERSLSVQVHPNDEQAARLVPPDLGKSEAWVVLAAEPGSVIYAGLKPGVDRLALESAVRAGTAENCLANIEPRVGDCIYLPAGTVHALGAGLLVAEIQQSSDTTYRLFDWNRVGPDGKPRALHVDEALGAIDFNRGPVSTQAPQPTERPLAERLVECPYFVLDRLQMPANTSAPVGGDNRFHVLMLLAGAISLTHMPESNMLQPGDVVLWPADLLPGTIRCDNPSTLLDVYLP
ncbi:MAG: type I phosphomannose isomerase catalytic subunit [Pirellulales bacterium]